MRCSRIVVGVCGAVAVWALVAQFRLVDPLFLADPFSTARTLARMVYSGRILPPTVATVRRALVALAIGGSIGVIAGLILGWARWLYEYCEVVIDFFRSTPVVALFPLFMIVFGLGDPSKIATATWAALLLILVNTTYGVRSVRQVRLDVCRSLGATNWQMIRYVILPESLPHVIAGFRVAVSIGLIVTVTTEMFLGTTEGLGKEIYNAGLIYDTTALYAWIGVSGLTGYALNKLVMLAERRLIHWAGH